MSIRSERFFSATFKLVLRGLCGQSRKGPTDELVRADVFVINQSQPGVPTPINKSHHI